MKRKIKRKLTAKQFDDFLLKRKFESTKAAFFCSLLIFDRREDPADRRLSKHLSDPNCTRSEILSNKSLRSRIAHIAATRFMEKSQNIYHYPYGDILVSLSEKSRYLFSHGKGYFFCKHENPTEAPHWERLNTEKPDTEWLNTEKLN